MLQKATNWLHPSSTPSLHTGRRWKHGSCSAKQPGKLGWALAPVQSPKLREWLSRGCSISYSSDHRSAGVACSREVKGETCWQERDLAGVTAVWETSGWQEAVSDHCSGASFKYINMVLHQRDFEKFLLFRRAQNIWADQQLCQVTAHSLHQGRTAICPKRITVLLPGVQRLWIKRT